MYDTAYVYSTLQLCIYQHLQKSSIIYTVQSQNSIKKRALALFIGYCTSYTRQAFLTFQVEPPAFFYTHSECQIPVFPTL